MSAAHKRGSSLSKWQIITARSLRLQRLARFSYILVPLHTSRPPLPISWGKTRPDPILLSYFDKPALGKKIYKKKQKRQGSNCSGIKALILQ